MAGFFFVDGGYSSPMAKNQTPTGPMTLGNMRSLGPRDLDVTCRACGFHTTVNVDAFLDDVGVPSFGPRMRCTRCGHLGASASPAWRHLRSVPPGR
jgi:hypothetical protein